MTSDYELGWETYWGGCDRRSYENTDWLKGWDEAEAFAATLTLDEQYDYISSLDTESDVYKSQGPQQVLDR